MTKLDLVAACPVCWEEVPLPPITVQTFLTTYAGGDSCLKVELGELPILQHTCQVPVVPRETS